DEWDSLSLLYTSGTTGDPKGVVYHHRGAYLNALGNALAFRLTADSVYLWTLPMFHCNGWTYPWAVTAAGGTHVCLRRVEPARIFEAIREHRVTHLCGAPTLLNMLIHAPAEAKVAFDHRLDVATGGAAAASATTAPVRRDGATLGEVMLRGNTIMKGYFKNPPATAAAFAGGWYHTGDLAVWHPDNYIEVKDRLKDIIITGGENVSSLEVEECLYRHPRVMEAAVVARPDPHWGETPCAFVTLKGDAQDVDASDIIAWCREHLAH